MEAVRVRPAVRQALVHARNQLARDRTLARNIEDTDDATHGGSRSWILRKSCPLQRRALGMPCVMAGGRQCDACGTECTLVDAIVGGDHCREAEPRRYDTVRRFRMPVTRGS